MSVPPDVRSISKASTIPEAVVVLLKPRGTNLRRLTGKYDGDEDLPAPGVTIDVLPQDTRSTVHALQNEIGSGYLVFVSERSFDFGRPNGVSLLKVVDPFDALRVMGTNGANQGLSVDDILARLRKWDALYGLRLYGVGFDWLEAEFVRQPPDMAAFAAEVYVFCPDVVEQGTSTVSALGSEMARSNSVALWWD